MGAAGRLTNNTPGAEVDVRSGGTLALYGSETIGLLTGAGSVLLGDGTHSGVTLTTGIGGASTFSGELAGPGGLTKVGTSTFTLSGANTYTGVTRVGGGNRWRWARWPRWRRPASS